MSDSKQRDPARWLQWAEDWYYFYHERVRLRGLTCPWYELPFPPPRHGFDYPPVSVDQKELLCGWTALVTVPVYVGFSKYLLDQGHIGFGVFAKERLRSNVTLNLYSGRAYLPTDQKDFCPDGAYGLKVQCLRPVECGLDREAHVEGHTFNVVSDPFRVSNANWTCLVNSPRECKAGDMVLVPERQNCLVSTEQTGVSGVPVIWAQRNIQPHVELLWDYGSAYWSQEKSKLPRGPSRAFLESCQPSGDVPLHWLDPGFVPDTTLCSADERIGVQKLYLQCYVDQWREEVALRLAESGSG
jgi:hypothetical protein